MNEIVNCSFYFALLYMNIFNITDQYLLLDIYNMLVSSKQVFSSFLGTGKGVSLRVSGMQSKHYIHILYVINL